MRGTGTGAGPGVLAGQGISGQGIAGEGGQGVGVVGLGRLPAPRRVGVAEDPFPPGRQRGEELGLVLRRQRPCAAAGAVVVGPGAQVPALAHPCEPLLAPGASGPEAPPPTLQLPQRLVRRDLQQVGLGARQHGSRAGHLARLVGGDLPGEQRLSRGRELFEVLGHLEYAAGLAR